MKYTSPLLCALLIGSVGHAEGLKDLLPKKEFYLGAAVDVRLLMDDPDYTDILERDFNLVVAENGMKMEASQPGPGDFSFGQGDYIYNYAQKNNMKLRGHTLLWHEQVPKWMTTGTWSKDELETIMKDHIQNVAKHYRGKVIAWDVLNEAISDSGGLRDTLWRKMLGDDYISRAFQYAREADPDAKLFYNDYNSETLNQKSNDVYELVKKLKTNGVPIDGVGMQMHLSLNYPPRMSDIKENMKRLAELGLEVHITEFDVKAAAFVGTPQERSAALAKLYSDVLRVCLDASNCTAFITWGVTDANTWLKGDSPLLYDGFYNPKPAYFAFKDTLKNFPESQVPTVATPQEEIPANPSAALAYASFSSPSTSTKQGGDIMKMSYNERNGDATIHDLIVSNDLAMVKYTLGKANGSSFAGAGIIVKSGVTGTLLDLSSKKTVTLKLAANRPGMLRIRIAGTDPNLINSGCYPVKYVNVTSTLQSYTLNVQDFMAESWCSIKPSIAEVMKAVDSMEVADIDLSSSARQGEIQLGEVVFQ